MTPAPIIAGLTLEQTQEVLKILTSVVEPQQNVHVWLFGSRATGIFRPYSDVDLLIEGDGGPPFTINQVQRALTLLDDSELPYKFDLVRSEDLAEPFRSKVCSQRKFLASLS